MVQSKKGRSTDPLTEPFAAPDNVEPFDDVTKRAIKFADLPEDVQRLLFHMDPDDVRLFRKALRFMLFTENLGGLLKWALSAFLGATATAVLFGEQLSKISEWRIWAVFGFGPK